MQRYAFSEPYVEVLPASALRSPPHCLAFLDLLSMPRAAQDIIAAPLALHMEPGVCMLHGVAIWFDCGFSDIVYTPPIGSGDTKPAGSGGAAATACDGDDLPPLEEASAPHAAPAAALGAAAAAMARSPPAPVAFSTSPLVKPTHWQQTLLLLDQPLTFVPAPGGQPTTISGTLSMMRDVRNPREYRFMLELAVGAARHSQSYHMR